VIPGFSPPSDGAHAQVDVDGQPVVVFNVHGALFAISARCTHVGGPLGEGRLSDHRVECPWHGSEFDLETGRVLRGPARTPVTAYRASMEKEGLVLEARPLDPGTSAGH